MSAGCCVTGENEKETLKKELGWLAGWAEGFARDLLAVEQALLPYAGGFGNGLHRNWGDRSDYSKEELCARIDAMEAMLGGLRKGLVRVDDENKLLLPRLINEIMDMKYQANGKKSIPVFTWTESSAVRAFIGDTGLEYDVVRIEGDCGFFRHKNESEVHNHLRDAIEKQFGRSTKPVDGKEHSKQKIALVFCDEPTAEYILTNHLNIILGFAKKHPGLRVFFHLDEIAEREVPMSATREKDEDGRTIAAASPGKSLV